MAIRQNKGAAFLFTRPMTFDGVEVKAGDSVPSTLTDKKLRMLHNTGRILLGVAPQTPAQTVQPAGRK